MKNFHFIALYCVVSEKTVLRGDMVKKNNGDETFKNHNVDFRPLATREPNSSLHFASIRQEMLLLMSRSALFLFFTCYFEMSR